MVTEMNVEVVEFEEQVALYMFLYFRNKYVGSYNLYCSTWADDDYSYYLASS